MDGEEKRLAEEEEEGIRIRAGKGEGGELVGGGGGSHPYSWGGRRRGACWRRRRKPSVFVGRGEEGSETLRIYNEFAKPMKFSMFFNDFGAPNPRESKTLRIYTEFAKPMKFCMFCNVFGIHLPIFIIKIPKNGSQIRVCRQRAAKTAAFQYFL